MNPKQRIQHLEKNIHFLKTQHDEVLKHLHDEIDQLKRENKELQFRIVMMQKQGSMDSTVPQPTIDINPEMLENIPDDFLKSATKIDPVKLELPKSIKPEAAKTEVARTETALEKQEDLKIIFLEEEIRELKKALSDEKKKTSELIHHLEQSESQSDVLRQEAVEMKQALTQAEEREQEEKQLPVQATGPLPFNATLNPLTVHLPAQMPRPPNLRECEIVIRYLQQVADKQLHELTQLKSDLRDVLYSHKWTPEAFLLAKAYVVSDEAKEQMEAGQTGKVALQPQQGTRKIISPALSSPDELLRVERSSDKKQGSHTEVYPLPSSTGGVPGSFGSLPPLPGIPPNNTGRACSSRGNYSSFDDSTHDPVYCSLLRNNKKRHPLIKEYLLCRKKNSSRADKTCSCEVKDSQEQSLICSKSKLHLPPLIPSLNNNATKRMNVIKDKQQKRRLYLDYMK